MKIPAGTSVYIGPPAKPIARQISEAIGSGLGKIPEVLEAHLPNVYIKGIIDPPAQVLFVVVEENGTNPHGKVGEVVREVLPKDCYIDIMELHSHDPQLPAIRASGTQLNLNRKRN